MRSFVGGLLTVVLISAVARGADRQDELFASWEQAQRSLKSLAVEFALEINDRLFNEQHKLEGVFRLIRTPKGELLASYDEIEKDAKFGRGLRFSALLNDGCLYWLDRDRKTAERLGKPPDAEIRRLAEEHLNPFVLLLDRHHADEKCKLEVIEQDESFTFLAVTARQVKRQGWFPDIFERGGIVLMNKNSETVPKDMPRRLSYVSPDGTEYSYDIKSWKLNAADAPKLEEFTRPEGRPGWKVNGPPAVKRGN
jgi:hypothetical protein